METKKQVRKPWDEDVPQVAAYRFAPPPPPPHYDVTHIQIYDKMIECFRSLDEKISALESKRG